MSQSKNLDRLHEPSTLSRRGGAAQGGSAKPQGEREQIDRQNDQRQQDRSEAADTPKQGSVGGNSNDNRSDQERASDARNE